MNPPSPREEIEIRITALLMGELPPDEAAALQTQFAADAELTALHARLRRAMDLLREASAIPEHPAPPVPARLSDERRARLLAHFKGGTKPGPVIVKPRRDWKWAVPLGLAASLMALIGGAMYVNGFALRRASFAGASGMGNPRGAEWESQPALFRYFRSDNGERDSNEANRSYFHYSSEGGLASAQPAANELQGDAGNTRKGGAVGTGALYLPMAVTEFSDGAFGGTDGTGVVAQAGGGGASGTNTLSVSDGGVISDPTSATPATREALDQTNPVAFSSLAAPKDKPVAERESQVAQLGWAQTDRPADATPPRAVALARETGAAMDFSKPADPAEPAYPTPITTSAPVARTLAESAPEPRAAEEMKRKAYLDVSGFQRDGTGLPALVDVAGRTGTLDLNGKSQVVENLSAATAGALSKTGAGTVVLSDSANDYAAGTTITGGTLRLTGGIGGAAGPQPTAAPVPAEPPSAGKPESNRRLARANTASDSQFALGLAQRELSVADAKPGAKMDGDIDGLARDGRDKPATTSLGLGLSNVTDLYDVAPRKGIKDEAANGRGEAAETLGRIATTKGTEIAARRELGEKNADGPTPFPAAPATPFITALGDKPVLSPDVVEVEGFINHGARIQPPAPGLPASGPAQAPKTEHSKEATDFGTVSGVVAGSGAVTLDKAAAGNWNLSGTNTFTGRTTVNAGTLSVAGTAAANIPANGESDGRKMLNYRGTGNTGETFADVIIKSGQRADVEVKREFDYEKEFAAPEIPKSLDGEGRGTVTKTGDGTLSLASAVTSAPKAPAATPAPRGGDAVVGADLYFEQQTAPQRPAVVAETSAGEKGATQFGRTDATMYKADDVLSIATFGAERDLKEGAKVQDRLTDARTDVDDESARNRQWMSSRERDKSNATEGKDDAKKSDSKAVRGIVAAEPAVVAQDENFITAIRISNPRGGTAEGEAQKKLAEVQSKEVEELGLDRLAVKSEVRPSADMPVIGRLFRSGQTAAKPAAPAEEVTHEKMKQVEEELTLRDREERKKSGDSKDALEALEERTVMKSEKLQKDVTSVQRKQEEVKLNVTSERAQQLLEKRVEEAKPALKEIEKIPEQEPEAPKPAPNPLIPQPEISTGENAFSTFSLNVSDVAFKLAGASLERGTMPDVSTLRTEEFINAFDYRDPEARAGAPLAFASERARYPFAQNRDVVRFSVKTAAAGRAPGKPLNVVLLLDNSGSMERADRIRILQEGLRTLSAQLQPQDRLSVVTFARTPRLWADGVAGDKAAEVTARVGEITPEGGTNLAAALDLGYATALKHYQPGSINHVVLLTDGAANLGNVDPSALKQKVEAHRKQGIALDCFGIGWEGLNDDMLEQLSRNGDGRYGFINTPEEAATNFAGQLAGALRVSASDVKVQVEWNPKRVTSYRQVGYAKHQLTKEQFRDNTVDAAELTAAESGNALYVVEVNPQGTGDLATVRVRFKVPGTSDYREHEWAVPFDRAAAPLENSSSSLRLSASAAAFSEMLAGSPFATEVTSDRLLGLLTGVPAIYGADARPKKLEWMIRQAKSISGR